MLLFHHSVLSMGLILNQDCLLLYTVRDQGVNMLDSEYFFSYDKVLRPHYENIS